MRHLKWQTADDLSRCLVILARAFIGFSFGRTTIMPDVVAARRVGILDDEFEAEVDRYIHDSLARIMENHNRLI